MIGWIKQTLLLLYTQGGRVKEKQAIFLHLAAAVKNEFVLPTVTPPDSRERPNN
jgi:hypothetical protein